MKFLYAKKTSELSFIVRLNKVVVSFLTHYSEESQNLVLSCDIIFLHFMSAVALFESHVIRFLVKIMKAVS